MRHARASAASHDAAKLRTSVANDENQTQGDSTHRVDEGLRRGDNEPRGRHLVVKFSYMKPPEGPSNLRKENDHESERGRHQHSQ